MAFAEQNVDSYGNYNVTNVGIITYPPPYQGSLAAQAIQGQAGVYSGIGLPGIFTPSETSAIYTNRSTGTKYYWYLDPGTGLMSWH